MTLLKNELFLIGGGGHAISTMQVLDENDKYITGYVDFKQKSQLGVGNINEQEFFKLYKEKTEKPKIFITVGCKKDCSLRSEIIIKYATFPIYPFISSTSCNIAKDVLIGDGSIIMPGACVRTKCKIGKHCIINTMSSIDHETVLKDNVQVGPGAILCGNVVVNENVFIGAGSIIFPGVNITKNTTIPAGSIIKK